MIQRQQVRTSSSAPRLAPLAGHRIAPSSAPTAAPARAVFGSPAMGLPFHFSRIPVTPGPQPLSRPGAPTDLPIPVIQSIATQPGAPRTYLTPPAIQHTRAIDPALLQDEMKRDRENSNAFQQQRKLSAAQTPSITRPLSPQANGTGMPDRLKAGVEALSGVAMDDVQVHYNSSKPARLQAVAYTQGTDIYVGPGQEKHLPHEAWHVAQQKQGRVKPTLQARGVAINDSAALEQEADAQGAKAAQGGAAPRSAIGLAGNQTSARNAPIQRQTEFLVELASYLGVESTAAAVAAALGISPGVLLAGLTALGTLAVGWSVYRLISYFTGVPEEKVQRGARREKKEKGGEEGERAKPMSPPLTATTSLPEVPPPTQGSPPVITPPPTALPPTPELSYFEKHRPKTMEELFIENNQQRNRNIEGLLADARRGRNTAPTVSAFKHNDSSTWQMQAPVFEDGVTSQEVQGVLLSPTDRTYYNDILAGTRTNNASIGGARIDARYHTHVGGNGGGGLAFYYRRVDDTNNVQPVIYAVAETRHGNEYNWKHNKGRSNTAP
jgi:hypothetical protein